MTIHKTSTSLRKRNGGSSPAPSAQFIAALVLVGWSLARRSGASNRWVPGPSNVVTCSYTSTCYFYDHERVLYVLVLDSDACGYVHHGYEVGLNAPAAAVKLFKEAPGAGNPT